MSSFTLQWPSSRCCCSELPIGNESCPNESNLPTQSLLLGELQKGAGRTSPFYANKSTIGSSSKIIISLDSNELTSSTSTWTWKQVAWKPRREAEQAVLIRKQWSPSMAGSPWSGQCPQESSDGGTFTESYEFGQDGYQTTCFLILDMIIDISTELAITWSGQCPQGGSDGGTFIELYELGHVGYQT